MEYYSLVAGLVEYSFDSELKGFDPKSIIEEILEGITEEDAVAVKLLYTYYDCLNLAALRAGRRAYNILGNIPSSELEQMLLLAEGLPEEIAKVLKAYAHDEAAGEVDLNLSFESNLFAAYYAVCESSKVSFLREWSQTERNIRNVVAALTARQMDTPVEGVLVGDGDIVEQISRSSAADFGLRGELSYIDALISAVGDDSNLLDKESRIDNIKWAEATELATFDYFGIGAVLSYLVRLNIVARWSELNVTKGREMFERLVSQFRGESVTSKL
ncbi:MAG: DUF2764 family protein [Rikenellaceae bacterium]